MNDIKFIETLKQKRNACDIFAITTGTGTTNQQAELKLKLKTEKQKPVKK